MWFRSESVNDKIGHHIGSWSIKRNDKMIPMMTIMVVVSFIIYLGIIGIRTLVYWHTIFAYLSVLFFDMMR